MLHPDHMTSLFENATEGIILTNGQGEIVMANPATEKMFDYSKEELIGNKIEILIPDSVRASHTATREGFYRKPSNRVMGQGRDLYGRRKDGTGVRVEVSLSHYKRDDELFVIAFIVDISKRKEIEDNMIQQKKELEKISNEIRKLNAELEHKVEERTMILKEALIKLEQSQQEISSALDKEKQLNEIKSRFVSMASHEFRTPLSTILSSASLLSRYTAEEDQEKRNRHINKIKGSVKNLNDILEDFLSLGKLEEGKVISQCSSFNLPDFIEDVIDEMKPLMKTNQVIRHDYTGQPEIISDKKLLRNILLNLLSNAVKFSNENSAIQIKSMVNEDHISISISDAGIGISEKDLEHLFTSFFRGANATNIQGTGLGLHIVKRYLDLLGGHIMVHSKLEEGTTFTVTFPSNPS
jgi:PAS domain S-box-containing protein